MQNSSAARCSSAQSGMKSEKTADDDDNNDIDCDDDDDAGDDDDNLDTDECDDDSGSANSAEHMRDDGVMIDAEEKDAVDWPKKEFDGGAENELTLEDISERLDLAPLCTPKESIKVAEE